jgi:hypothetical protein
MKTIVVIAVGLFAASSAAAVVRVTVTPQDLATATNQADAKLVPYRRTRISPADIRAVRCIAPDEEPTEFQCKWRLRLKDGWIGRKTWLVIDGSGWRVMDG